jgi:predicted ATPase
MLEPSAMRTPSSYRDPDRIDARGANLPAAVNRLQRQEKNRGQTCAELTNQLAQIVDDIRDVRVVDDTKTETFTLEAKGSGDIYHAARSLSDGTLRFLALSVLSLDPMARGLICLEEPENGIHPERVSAMVTLLRDIAVDPSEPIGPDNPLRQVVINTHSPDVLQACRPEEVIYVGTEETASNHSVGQITVIRVPENSWRRRKPARQLSLALGQLQPYTREGALPTEWEQLLFRFADKR